MRIPTLRGVIARRLLINYRVDPEVLARLIPPPFRPQTVNGYGIAGICLIRLEAIRPAFAPVPFGLSSENAAHRLAVEWDENGERRTGVYIPRRDTASRWTVLVGGRLFPGVHHHARIKTDERADHLHITLDSNDDATHLAVAGQVAESLPASTLFGSLPEASDFFAGGALGYSVTRTPGEYDGLELRCLRWAMVPFAVEQLESSFYEDDQRFPRGSIEFDCALLMRGIEHEWHARTTLCE